MYLDAATTAARDGSFGISHNGKPNIFSPLPLPHQQGKLGTMYTTDVGSLWVRSDGSGYEFDEASGQWNVVGLSGWWTDAKKKSWGYVKDGTRWVTRQVKDAYNWVASKVIDFDNWMLDNVPGYNYVSDFVIEMGPELSIFLGETLDGLVDILIYSAGAIVVLAVGAACSAGIANGIPIPPDMCSALAAAAGAATIRGFNKLKEEVIDEWNKPEAETNDRSQNPMNNGTQALAMGLHADTCGLPVGLPGRDAPPGTPVTYVGREPDPSLDPCLRRDHWQSYLAQARMDPNQASDLPYYECRAGTAGFQCDKERMRRMGILTGNMSALRLFPKGLLAKNNLSAISKFNMGSRAPKITTAAAVFKKPIASVEKAPSPKDEARRAAFAQELAKKSDESDNTYMWLSLVVVGGSALYYAKKKGMF